FAAAFLVLACGNSQDQLPDSHESVQRDQLTSSDAFPAIIPLEKPADRLLSDAMSRLYDKWDPHEDRANELYSNFKFTPLPNLGRSKNASRRDPSKVIRVDGKYYVYYTGRKTKSQPVGVKNATDELPAYDWDLADVWYATSEDGFTWHEEGIAVPRNPQKGSYGDRSATTTDILILNNRYYLYYQAFTGRMGDADPADVTVAWSNSPDGPWTKLNKPVIEKGKSGEWDEAAIHDPCPLIFNGKIYLYYKGQNYSMRDPNALVRAQGLAVAEDPLGPFVKSKFNPITNSGHETNFFPFRNGIAVTVSIDGPEKNTVQFSPDGINFDVASHIQMVPVSPGPFIPDAFSSDGNGRGFTWGLCHINAEGGGGQNYCFLARFDCDLSLDANLPIFKKNNLRFDESTYFQKVVRLSGEHKKQAIRAASELQKETASGILE
ncbi:MAG: family 43 glycosylhydrolase, partial [Saprospiraceae bacterium]|nr:family 43 glycosylhydrolase [Saprospiraceae bacterium]